MSENLFMRKNCVRILLSFESSPDYFVALKMLPCGEVWLFVALVFADELNGFESFLCLLCFCVYPLSRVDIILRAGHD